VEYYMYNEEEQLKELRKKIFLTAYAGGIGHIASAYSVLETLYALYIRKAMHYDPKNPKCEDRDRFIMSKGHASLAVYNILSMAGFFPEEELMTFQQPGSRLGGEPHMLEVPGVEACTGSLGHGLSFGTGMAAALKSDGKGSRVFVIIGDGESQEGTIWEAAMSAAKLRLDNLTVILDDNRLQKMGLVSDIMGIEAWNNIWSSFGWEIIEADGHSVDEMYAALSSRSQNGRPRLIIAHTVKGKGVSIMENQPNWHWRLPSKKEMKTVLMELNISEEELEKCKKHI
jgi:transketolase